ncbi:MAG: hypothetical protein ABF723_13420 [Lentilactobacillus hilgardii]|uniref:Uncharacterized protein n=1 Tax=Lentilactobacillus hilgardii TaxID=1588 RepID=A0A6P1E664_LENHI|nr:hypothetical protein [Lentilactobacillus hilgardii]MCI2020563.1 hypothetical protein [Lentilactobacillus buchneri]QHB51610.1 hypothetical protein GQR93_04940 [Lentilactobacillus hilgardii]
MELLVIVIFCGLSMGAGLIIEGCTYWECHFGGSRSRPTHHVPNQTGHHLHS